MDTELQSHLNNADEPARERKTGVCKFFAHEKRFGFISGDDGVDYFMHLSDCADGAPSAGDGVEFFTTANARNGKVKAISVRIIEAAT